MYNANIISFGCDISHTSTSKLKHKIVACSSFLLLLMNHSKPSCFVCFPTNNWLIRAVFISLVIADEVMLL